MLVLILMISFVSADPVLTFQNEDIKNGETILATLYSGGGFAEEIRKGDIGFYEGRREKYFEYDIAYFDNTYYIYSYANRVGNFSIKINDVLYNEGDQLKSISIDEPFTINDNFPIDDETNETIEEILGIKPGALNTLEDSSVLLTNKGNVPIDIEYDDVSMTLQPSQSHEIIPDPELNFSLVEVSSYKNFIIPIINPLAETVINPVASTGNLKSNPSSLNFEIFIDDREEFEFEILNTGTDEVKITNIESDLEFVEIEEVESMLGKQRTNLTLEINPSEPGHFDGSLLFYYNSSEKKFLLEVPLNIYVLPSGSNESDFEVINNSCSNMGGEVCVRGYICNSESRFDEDGNYCCLGQCVVPDISEEKESGGGVGWIVAIIILGGLGGIGYYLYKKQKGSAVKKPEDGIRKAVEKFEKGAGAKNPTTNRVNGNLGKA